MNNPIIHEAVRRIGAAAEPSIASSLTSDDGLPGNPDPVAERMPAVMRIKSLERVTSQDDRIRNRAVLFHQRCTICVSWITQQVDTRLHRYGLVTIQRAQTVRSADGALRIDRLLPADRPLANVNLFDTVLPEWVKDRELVSRAAALWEKLPRPLGHLVNALLWESGRFHRYVMGPSSIQGHHNAWNGNLRHSVEVAEQARDIGRKSALVNEALLIAGGLLHAPPAAFVAGGRLLGEFP